MELVGTSHSGVGVNGSSKTGIGWNSRYTRWHRHWRKWKRQRQGRSGDGCSNVDKCTRCVGFLYTPIESILNYSISTILVCRLLRTLLGPRLIGMTIEYGK